MSGSRILVTGGTGMIGRAAVALLTERGYRVRVLVNEKGMDLSPKTSVELIAGNLLDWETCLKATQDADAVVHLAGRAHIRTRPELFAAVNVDGTRNLIEAAGRNAVPHFVFASSAAVYGSGNEYPYVETDALKPMTPYGASKAKAEEVVTTSARQFGMSFTILRPSVVYGPHDRGNVLRMIKAIKRKRFVTVGDGSTLKSMIYVENMADVISLSLGHREAHDQIFNVADPTPYSTREIATAISETLGRSPHIIRVPRAPVLLAAGCLASVSRILGRPSIVTPRDILVLASNMVLDVSKIEDLLGYRSRVLLRDGLSKTLSWLSTSNGS